MCQSVFLEGGYCHFTWKNIQRIYTLLLRVKIRNFNGAKFANVKST